MILSQKMKGLHFFTLLLACAPLLFVHISFAEQDLSSDCQRQMIDRTIDHSTQVTFDSLWLSGGKDRVKRMVNAARPLVDSLSFAEFIYIVQSVRTKGWNPVRFFGRELFWLPQIRRPSVEEQDAIDGLIARYIDRHAENLSLEQLKSTLELIYHWSAIDWVLVRFVRAHPELSVDQFHEVYAASRSAYFSRDVFSAIFESGMARRLSVSEVVEIGDRSNFPQARELLFRNYYEVNKDEITPRGLFRLSEALGALPVTSSIIEDYCRHQIHRLDSRERAFFTNLSGPRGSIRERLALMFSAHCSQ